MPSSLYLTTHQPAKRARLNRSSNRSILLALHIEDGCRQPYKIVRLAVGNLNRSLPESLFPCETLWSSTTEIVLLLHTLLNYFLTTKKLKKWQQDLEKTSSNCHLLTFGLVEIENQKRHFLEFFLHQKFSIPTRHKFLKYSPVPLNRV